MEMININEKVAEIVEVITKGTHNLVIFLVASSCIQSTTNDIYRIENRLIVKNLLKSRMSKSLKQQRDRISLYRYPCYHVLVMTPALFRKDDKYIKALAKVNKILVISGCTESYTL